MIVYRGTGVAINHGFIEGQNYSNKQYWKSIGIAKFNYNINLHGLFVDIKINNRPYQEIPVPLLFQSDGRQGRVAIKKEYLSTLHNSRKKQREISQQKKLEVENKFPDGLPF